MAIEKKYLNLLRFEDQHLSFGAAIMGGLVIKNHPLWILLWATAVTSLSITAFMLNEITDSQDTDKYTWNQHHISSTEDFDPKKVLILFSFFSLAGFIIAVILGLIWWAIAIYIIGILYSLKPFRLKGRFALDLLSQLAVWAVLPAAAPLWLSGNVAQIPDLAIPMSFLILSSFFPYQLADLEADQKAKLKNTHTVLGMETSLKFGITLGAIGVLSFFGSGIFIHHSWSWPFLFLTLFTMKKYLDWLNLYKTKSKLLKKELILHVNRTKPLSQLLTPYLLIHFLFT